VTAAIQALAKLGAKDIEGVLPGPGVLAIIEPLSPLQRVALMLRLGQQMELFFRCYQAEVLSPKPAPQEVAAYGIATGIMGQALGFIEGTVPGCADQERTLHETRSLIFRIKQVLYGKLRGELILPPGCEGGPPKEG
jgi:hypothetical protein